MFRRNNKNFLRNKNNKGFTLLISLVLTSILLIVSFVVANIALKQIVLNYSGGESLQAFYAADSGVECAMYWDVKNSGISAFSTSTNGSILCNNQTITTGSQLVPTVPVQPSRIGGGGNSGLSSIFSISLTEGCAIVTVTKQTNGDTTIDSRGYNTCNSSDRRFERGITITY